MSQNVGLSLATALRTAAQAFASGDQVAPRAVLWLDPERLWEGVLPELRPMLPELFALGEYAPKKRTGPALWLRCIEARVVEGAPADGAVPIFYLPGVGKETLRIAEECPKELAPLVELQFRGTLWLHPNNKEWTPYAFFVSNHGGLELDLAKDLSTLEALARALHSLMSEPVAHLKGKRLDADFFNGMIAPDAVGLLLRWLSDPEAFKQRRSEPEWKAFCEQCKADFKLNPAKDGPLKAARLLAERASSWNQAWQRFAEHPASYPGVVDWLRRAAPKALTMFDTAENWPSFNETEERELQQALESLADRPQDEAIRRVGELEKQHGERRAYPWSKLGLSPLATALEPLAQLAELCKTSPGAPTLEAYGEYYAKEGWRVDAAAIAAMAACDAPDLTGAILGCVRAVYLPWVENTARHLQKLIRANGESVSKRFKPMETTPGRLVLFVDGLRMDLAMRLAEGLAAADMEASWGWDWSTIPSVTATAKPAASPIAELVHGGDAGDEFSTRLALTGQPLTQDRFRAALTERGWQCLGPGETGDPAGSAWSEAGALDKRGHAEGWKLARSIEQEIRDLVSKVGSLIKAGWSEVIVVTDHGWLLMPGGLPKVELKSFLAENRWGRCASMKPDDRSGTPTFKWHWNPAVSIASPPGAGCFRASMEYSHGGVSLQEMVTIRLRVNSLNPTGGSARIVDAKWTGAKCRVSLKGDCAGVRIDVRSSMSDPSTSLLADRQPREATPEGKATLFLEDDSTIGMKAEIVLLDTADVVIHSLSTTLGE